MDHPVKSYDHFSVASAHVASKFATFDALVRSNGVLVSLLALLVVALGVVVLGGGFSTMAPRPWCF